VLPDASKAKLVLVVPLDGVTVKRAVGGVLPPPPSAVVK